MTTAFATEKIEKLRKFSGQKRVGAFKAFGDNICKKLAIPEANEGYKEHMNKVDVAFQLAGNVASHQEQEHE